jgi:hypothetical protein
MLTCIWCSQAFDPAAAALGLPLAWSAAVLAGTDLHAVEYPGLREATRLLHRPLRICVRHHQIPTHQAPHVLPLDSQGREWHHQCLLPC